MFMEFICNFLHLLQFTEDSHILCNPGTHDHHCELTQGPASDFFSTTYGVNRQSLLNSLQHYHVCDMGLPPDIMHDVLEGVIPYTMKLLLKHVINEARLLTLQQLNSCLSDFSYGYIEASDKPSLITPTVFHSNDKTKFGQSGEQH